MKDEVQGPKSVWTAEGDGEKLTRLRLVLARQGAEMGKPKGRERVKAKV